MREKDPMEEIDEIIEKLDEFSGFLLHLGHQNLARQTLQLRMELVIRFYIKDYYANADGVLGADYRSRQIARMRAQLAKLGK